MVTTRNDGTAPTGMEPIFSGDAVPLLPCFTRSDIVSKNNEQYNYRAAHDFCGRVVLRKTPEVEAIASKTPETKAIIQAGRLIQAPQYSLACTDPDGADVVAIFSKAAWAQLVSLAR